MTRDISRIREAIAVAIAVDNSLFSSLNGSHLLDLAPAFVSFVEGMEHPDIALEAIATASNFLGLTTAHVADDVSPVARFLIGAHAIYNLLRLGSEQPEVLGGDEVTRVCTILGISKDAFMRTAAELWLRDDVKDDGHDEDAARAAEIAALRAVAAGN